MTAKLTIPWYDKNPTSLQSNGLAAIPKKNNFKKVFLSGSAVMICLRIDFLWSWWSGLLASTRKSVRFQFFSFGHGTSDFTSNSKFCQFYFMARAYQQLVPAKYWLNLSIDCYKIKCKGLFFKNWKTNVVIITANRIE